VWDFIKGLAEVNNNNNNNNRSNITFMYYAGHSPWSDLYFCGVMAEVDMSFFHLSGKFKK
jgi:hypothetical protein